MEKKIAERTNVLTETENKSFIHAVINAVTKGYSDNTVLEDILDLVRRKEVSKGVIQAAPEALRAYGESINNSLKFLADQIDELEIIDEPTVRKKDIPAPKDEENVVEEEMKSFEENQGSDKTASLDKFSSLKVSEDWKKYDYNEKDNCMSGILKICFNQDMSKYKNASNKVILSENDLNDVLTKIFSYFSSEFKNLKANLSKEIFASEIKFSCLEKGEAEVKYSINGAF
jgi:bisphosphoglycerate-dependent phosphoglycerate mutase